MVQFQAIMVEPRFRHVCKKRVPRVNKEHLLQALRVRGFLNLPNKDNMFLLQSEVTWHVGSGRNITFSYIGLQFNDI